MLHWPVSGSCNFSSPGELGLCYLGQPAVYKVYHYMTYEYDSNYTYSESGTIFESIGSIAFTKIFLAVPGISLSRRSDCGSNK